jgi:hypothetical protein
LDIVVGGRRNSVTKRYSGLRWFEAPKERTKRRNLSEWTLRFIDPEALSGHGFVIADIDADGDDDIVDANADWDTSEWDEEMYWYENPGNGTQRQLQPWERHLIWRSHEFYAKPQIGVGDFDGDGSQDLVTQTQNFVHLFRRTSVNSVESLQADDPGAAVSITELGAGWERVPIKKPETIQWIGRPIRFVDLNADGRLDILGMLIHNDGLLPGDKWSVFWMEHEPGRDWTEWTTYPIKISDGYNSWDQWTGEKWDHALPVDVDGDGDLDIVGNVEEHHRKVDGEDRSFFSVVWFENPLR